MAFSRGFCGFLASLMIVFTAHNTFAAGYMCTKKYTRCNGLYYPNTSGQCVACGTNTTDTRSCSISCTIANASSVSTANGTQTCNGPYKSGGTSCTGCADNAWGECRNATCKATACNENYYLSNGACNTCPKNSSSNANNANSYCNCKTNEGWYRDANTNSSQTSGNTGCDVIQVTLDKNGGTGGTDAIYSRMIATINPSTPPKFHTTPFVSGTNNTTITAPTKNYYTFDGYYTAKTDGIQKLENNMVAHYRPEYSSIKMFLSSPTIWYAQWSPISYTITYNFNGGSGENCTTSYNIETATFSLCTPTKTGYTFNGWYSTANFTGSAVSQITKGSYGNKTFYAKWTANTYTVTLDANGGTLGTTTSVTATFDSAMPAITATTLPTRRGYTFTGFYDAASNGNKYYNADGTSARTWNKANNTTTLYAQWSANVYTITLWSNPQGSNIGNANNTTDANPSTIYQWYDNGWYNVSNPTSATTSISTVTIPTQRGYTFTGFYDDTTRQIDENGTITVANDYYADENTDNRTTTITAHWSANTYTITFDQTGGTGGTEKRDVTYGNTVKSITTPMKPGHTFAGYYADGIKYFDEYGNYAIPNVDNQWRHADNITLSAAWTICPAGSYCPGESSHDIRLCADLERVPNLTFDDPNIEDNDTYWSQSDYGAINPDDCYRICKSTGDPISNDASTNNGHGTLICATGHEVGTQCRAYYDPNRGDTDSGSCKYKTTKGENGSCHTGYSPSFAGHEIASCEPDGYHVTYHANNGDTDNEWTYTQNCMVFGFCPILDLTSGANKLPNRTGYLFTGWNTSREYNEKPWNAGEGNDLKTLMPGENNDGPTGDVPLYAVWGECDYGYYWNGLGGSYGACTACPKDSYKNEFTIANGAAQSCTKCDAGWYTTGTATTSLPGVDDGCIICPAGSYCTNGFGLQSCPAYPNSDPNFAGIPELTGVYYTSYVENADINGCWFDCPEFDVEYGHATPDVTRINRPAECTYTCVSVTGNPGHVVNGRCKEDSCNPEYEMTNGICTECNRENAMSYRAGGNCIIDACVDGYHPDDLRKNCVANTESCIIANAVVAEKIWDPINGTMGACTPIECEYGYHIDGNLCVSDFADCKIDNGTGQMEWDAVHNRWGECMVAKCMPGYTDDPYESNEPTKKCGECRNKFGVTFRNKFGKLENIAVASYKNGCEIESCMYQGELYNLDGDVCVPICDIDGYSDETGEMKWNPETLKCERTCYKDKGYISWEDPLVPGN